MYKCIMCYLLYLYCTNISVSTRLTITGVICFSAIFFLTVITDIISTVVVNTACITKCRTCCKSIDYELFTMMNNGERK